MENGLQRVAFKMKLIKGFEAEYQKRHEEIWPNLQQLLKDSGICEYSIFLEDATGNLFGFLKIENHVKLDELPSYPVMQKWWLYMGDIMETNPDHTPYSIPLKEVFYLP